MSSDKDETQNNQEDRNESEAQASEADESTSAEDQLSQLQNDLAKAQNDFLYLRAEFDNYKRQAIKERSDLIKYGGVNIIRDLLEVLDNFERALSAELTSDNVESFKKGMEMTASEMQNVLSRYGLKAVNAYGEAFDPSMHEALSSEETAEVPAGHVSREFKKAYKLHDKLIRPAQVVVAKEPSDSGEES